MKLGIDLGTTNTVIARDGMALESEKVSEPGCFLPSVVAYLPNGRQLVGANARRRRAIDPRNTIYSSKRLIGRSQGSEDAAKFAQRYPFELVADDGGAVCFSTRSGVISPVDVAAEILRYKYDLSGVDAGGALAVVSVPSKFGKAEREATLEATRRSGLKQSRIVDEPIATAWAYLRSASENVERVAVYDLGGGTFDFAVVDCSSTTFRVIAHGGDLYLGGDDIDRAIAAWVIEKVLTDHGWDLGDDASIYARLVLECERAKIRAAFSGSSELQLAQVDPSAPFGNSALVLTREQIAALSATLIQKTFVICDEVLHRSGNRASQIDQIFLAGGTTQFSFVHEGVEAYFGRPPRCDYDPMEVISIGASVVANLDV